MSDQERLIIGSGDAMQPFNYAVGVYGSVFFEALKEKRLLGVKCPGCNKVYIPPRRVCGPCYREMKEFVEVGPQGVIGTYTIMRYAFIDPATGEQKPIPYGYGFVKLDGADTLFQHYISLEKEDAVKIGARVEPVFTDSPQGMITDILNFRVIG